MEYAKRLLSFVKDNHMYRTWRFHLFSNIYTFMEQGKDQQLDGVLMESIAYDDATQLPSHPFPVFLLTEHIDDARSSNQILKYQPIPTLLYQLQQRIHEQSGKHIQANVSAGTGLIGITSSIARSGKTVFALHLCAALGARNSRVFYLNLEMWNSSEPLLEHKHMPSSVQSYSDFLYLIKTQPEHAGQWLAKHTYYDERLKFERLLPFEHSADRVQLSKEDALHMLGIIQKSKRYDYIIIDLSEGITEWSLSLLAAMNAHFQVHLADESWMEKHNQALLYSQSAFGELYEQVTDTAIPIIRETNAPFGRNNDEQRGVRLPYIEQWDHRRAHILEAAPYRAAVEKCTALLTRNEVAPL